jgi:hypothetical protein
LVTAALLVVIFSALVIWFRSDLRTEIHLKIIERDAAVLYPMALQQLAEGSATEPSNASGALTALLKSASQKGMLAVAVFDHDGNTIESVPANQLFVELPTTDYLKLQNGAPISRYHPAFPLDQYFAGPGFRPSKGRPRCLRSSCRCPAPVPPPRRGMCDTTSMPDRSRAS